MGCDVCTVRLNPCTSLTKDFGLGKGRKELGLATQALVELPEVLMKRPKITIPLRYCYLQREILRERERDFERERERF